MSDSPENRTYRVLDVLGRGGFGTVYRAELVGVAGFTKVVALKVLRDEVSARTAELERLREEARMLGQLHHRAIVQVDGLVRLDGRWAVVMEFVEGVSLKEVLDARGPLPLPVALEIVAEIASALHEAYELATTGDGAPLRLLHRDLKPSNLQVTSSGAAKLLDFGVARPELAPRDPQTQLVLGSVPYLAPERLALRDTHQGDMYALGVTLLELIDRRLAGRPSQDPAEHAARVEAGLAHLRLTLELPALDELLRRLLAFDPEDRPSAEELERACHELRQRVGGESLAAWARRVVPEMLDAQSPQSDELTGSTLSESPELGAGSSLSGLLGASRTWDDDGPVVAVVTLREPSRSTGGSKTTGSTTAQQAATRGDPLARPSPSPIASTRRPPLWAIALVAAGVLVAATAAAVFVVGGVLAAVGAWIWLSVAGAY